MKNKNKQIIGLCFIIIFFSFRSIGQLQREGLINNINYYSTNLNSISQYPLVKKANKIWFLDSCVIWEERINYESSESTDSGIITKISYPVDKYIYMDLRNKHCQDYLIFKDTATPFCNYYLKYSDRTTILGLLLPNDYTDSLKVFENLTDTMINNTLLKRVYLFRKTLSEGYIRNTYYLNYNLPQNIFHFGSIAKKLEEIYHGCKVVSLQSIFDSSKVKITEWNYEFIRDKLTNEEKKVFSRWQYNSKKTNLPLLSYTEVEKIVYPTPEHENPTIKFLPFNKHRQ